MADSYTLRDLIAAASGAERLSLSERAVRQYVADGLLPPPRGQGLTARYSDEHLEHLRLVLRLVNQYVPLPEIRRWMHALTPSQRQALLERPAVPRLPVEGDALSYLQRLLKTLPSGVSQSTSQQNALQARRSGLRQMLKSQATDRPPISGVVARRDLWIHVTVTPDILLLVRDPDSPPGSSLTDRLVAAIQGVLGETTSGEQRTDHD